MCEDCLPFGDEVFYYLKYCLPVTPLNNRQSNEMCKTQWRQPYLWKDNTVFQNLLHSHKFRGAGRSNLVPFLGHSAVTGPHLERGNRLLSFSEVQPRLYSFLLLSRSKSCQQSHWPRLSFMLDCVYCKANFSLQAPKNASLYSKAKLNLPALTETMKQKDSSWMISIYS